MLSTGQRMFTDKKNEELQKNDTMSCVQNAYQARPILTEQGRPEDRDKTTGDPQWVALP